MQTDWKARANWEVWIQNCIVMCGAMMLVKTLDKSSSRCESLHVLWKGAALTWVGKKRLVLNFFRDMEQV